MARFDLLSLVLLIVLSSLTVVRANEESVSLESELEQMSTTTKSEDSNSLELLQDQNNGFNIEKRQGFRPRPYITNRVCPYRMRNSPLCCAGMLIDKPLVKTCCRGVIVLKGQCGRRMGKCGRTLFNRRYEKCCRRQVIPRRESCTRKRCGRTRYMTFSHQCCNGKVIPKGQTCVPFPVKTRCGSVLFNPHRYKCCFKRVVSLHSPCSSWTPCGHTFYDSQHQQCCNGQVLSLRSPCIPFKCGGLNFNPRKQKCCSGQIYPKFLMCPNPYQHRFCGSNVFNPSFQRCCQGYVVAPLRSTCRRCGRDFYIRSGFKCCHGNQIVRNFVRCNAYG